MVQYWECDEPDPCQYRVHCTIEHKRKKVWKPHTKISLRPGPMHQHLTRIAKQVAHYKGTERLGYTGEVEIFTLDLGSAVPMWSDAERSAYRMGGLESVKRLQKGLAAEARQNAREANKAAREAASAAKAKARAERKALKSSRWSEIKVP